MGDYCSKGVLTVDEAADGFIFQVVIENRIPSGKELAQVLAPEIAAQMYARLKYLESVDFQWTPLVIGEGLSDESLQEFRRGLKELYEAISP